LLDGFDRTAPATAPPSAVAAAPAAAALFADRPAYAAAVLRDRSAPVPHAAPPSGPHGSSYAYAFASVAGALAGAGAALFLRSPRGRRALRPVVDALHGWHSGHIGDDATWAVVGVVVLGWTLAVVVR
jgi:hypothetical protein